MLAAPPMPRNLIQYFGSGSTQTCNQLTRELTREIFDYVDSNGSPRRW